MADVLDSSNLDYLPRREGHSIDLCERLRTDVRRIAKRLSVQKSKICVAMVGDASRTGLQSEFDVYRSFFNCPGAQPGLRFSQGQCCDVPGNHDHWDGQDQWPNVPAFNPNLTPAMMRPTAWQKGFASEKNDFSLEVFGVDSNSGLKHKTTNPKARGEIHETEFRTLQRELSKSVRNERQNGLPVLRIVLCHHAFSRRNRMWPFDAYPIGSTSRRKLLAISARYSVAAVLTGHTHHFHFKRYHCKVRRLGETQAQRCNVYEIRSPTAIQDGNPTLLNGFWFHEITLDNAGDFFWNPKLYLYDGGRFQASNKTFDEFKL